ncbi:MAG: YidC/Oxa1 family membrane protein insertase [Candidatus Heteroscillospira sp.]|jgi:YidC/Oxa1 family membrane protein insertase
MSIITVPFSWLLLKLYEPVQNFGVAIILFALVVKLVLLPFQLKSKRSMMRMSSLTPMLKELEKKHGGNKQKYQMEVSKLYQEEKINPMSGCLWTLIPFPILIALYSVVRSPLTHVMRLSQDEISAIAEKLGEYGVTLSGGVYGELEMAKHVGAHFEELKTVAPGLLDLNFEFLGMNLCDFPKLNFFSQVDWSLAESWAPALGLFLIPFVSAFLSWLTMKVSSSAQTAAAPEQAGMMRSMNIMMPLMSAYIGFIMPAAMGVYWIANSVFAIIQEIILNSHFKKVLDAEAAERNARIEARMAEAERKREEAERRKAEGEILSNKNTSKRKLDAKARTREAERRAAERAAERAASGLPEDKKPESQVGSRRYARGRAYVSDRYGYAGEVSDVDNIGDVEDEQTESVCDAVETAAPAEEE